MFDTRYDMRGAPAACVFSNAPAACIAQIDMGDGLLYGDYGILEPSKMGLEGDLCLPPLESSRSVEENNINAAKNNNIDLKSGNNNLYNNNNSCFSNSTGDQGLFNNKVGDVFGLENNWQGENLRVGEWDFEGLMDNISSFPFLDFQVE